MQNNIQNILISYWYNKMDYNPKEKIESLGNSINSIIDTPLIYNTEDANRLFKMPRIEGISSDKRTFFSMSLINATVRCDIENMDNDEVILLINNYSQLFYDILKDVYNLDILYISVRIEITSNIESPLSFLANKYNLSNKEYEDLSFKRGFIKDNYYINYIQSSGREYNFNVQRNEKSLEQDLFDQTLLISLSNAKLNREYLLTTIEINDRYAYNIDSNYRTKKDDIRGMILEIKDILEKEKYLNI